MIPKGSGPLGAVMTGLAAFRIALGAASWIAPRQLTRAYGVPEDRMTPELEYMTRVFGGRLILEKDGALGTAGSSTLADANTFINNSASTIAFRAPAGSSGFSYNTVEWIHTDGTGAPGFGQVRNAF